MRDSPTPPLQQYVKVERNDPYHLTCDITKSVIPTTF